MDLMMKLWDIWHFYPSFSVLVSLFSLSSCLNDIFIYWFMFICWWCLSFMNELQYCLLLDLVESIMHLCLILLMIQLLLCSRIYFLSFPKILQPLKHCRNPKPNLFYWILSWVCVGLFLFVPEIVSKAKETSQHNLK